MMPKPDGSVYVCIDFQKPSAVSAFNAYPMPRIEAFLRQVGKATLVSTLNLTKGYWQIPLREADKEKTAFPSPMGLYQFTKMPFGLHGAAASFQCLMDKALQSVPRFVLKHIDDIIIFS